MVWVGHRDGVRGCVMGYEVRHWLDLVYEREVLRLEIEGKRSKFYERMIRKGKTNEVVNEFELRVMFEVTDEYVEYLERKLKAEMDLLEVGLEVFGRGYLRYGF